MFLELRECKARSNSVSEGVKYLIDTYIIISYSQLFYNFQIFTKEDVGGKEKIKQKKQGIIPAFIMSLSYGTCIILLNFL